MSTSTPGSPPHGHGIGLVPCIAFAVGTMIGGGVFTLSGTAVDRSGPSAVVAYLLAGAVMLLCAISFVVVSSRAAPGRSGYDPIGQVLGPGWRFLVMWGFWLSAVSAVAFVLVSFGTYLRGYFLDGVGVTAAALVALALLALLNLGPSDLVGRAETALVVVKVAILLLLVAVGLGELAGDDLRPFASGSGSLLGTTAMLFTAYTGFNVVTNMAGSVRDPERTVPRAIVASILIAAAIYVGVILALLASGVDSFGPDGLGKAASALMGHGGALLVAFAACVSTLSSANANVLGSSELAIRLAAQGDVPASIGRTTARGHAVASVLGAAALAAVLLVAGDTDTIIGLSNVTAIVAMVIVCVAAARIARAPGAADRGVRVPGGAAVPVAGAVAAAAQLPSLGWVDVAIGGALMCAGLLVFGWRHDRRREVAAVRALERTIERLETPVARALRRRQRA